MKTVFRGEMNVATVLSKKMLHGGSNREVTNSLSRMFQHPREGCLYNPLWSTP